MKIKAPINALCLLCVWKCVVKMIISQISLGLHQRMFSCITMEIVQLLMMSDDGFSDDI